MRKRFEYVNHTADVEFRAYGDTLDSAFSNAFAALFDTIAYVKKLSTSNGKPHNIKINENADNIENLVWQALQQALSIGDANGLFFYKVAKIALHKSKKGYSISAVLKGKKEKPEYAKLDVKGISRYDLTVKEKDHKFIINVVVDV